MYKFSIDIINLEPQLCFTHFICANNTFIAIYGVVFTIVISLVLYIYGLQNKSEKMTLIDRTNLQRVTTSCFSFFAISFISLPNPLYEFVNFSFVAYILMELFGAFQEFFKFHKDRFSGEKAVKEFKEGVIRKRLDQLRIFKKRNDSLSKDIEGRYKKEIIRFLFSEDDNSYYLIRTRKSGYITDIDLNILFANKDSDNPAKNSLYYVPYYISYGAPIGSDTVILGIKKDGDQKIDEDRLRSFISVSDKCDNPTSYIEAETRSYYPEMISLLNIDDAKGLELKLNDFSSFVDYFISKEDSYIDIIQFINDDIIFALQKYAFKQGDIDCITEVVSFSLGYIYQALDKKSEKIFNIFFRNFGYAFYEAFNLDNKKRAVFFDIYFRWLNNVAKYSLKPGLERGNYSEFVTTFLSGVNEWLKIAFDHKDINIFDKTLLFLDDSFSCETYEHDANNLFNETILTKKAVIFGFTAWIYKDFSAKKGDGFYREVLSKLLSTLAKGPIYYTKKQDDLNYYLNLYLKSIELSESKSSFGWGHWGMPEGEVFSVTIREDIKNLLADRILNIISAHPELDIDIQDKNYNDELSRIKQGDIQFDILINKTKESLIATENLNEAEFDAAKTKFYEVFSKIAEKYELDIKCKLIQQTIDDDKFVEFVKQNFESYKKSRVLYTIQKFTKDSTKKSLGFGYNVMWPKAQFVKETNMHYFQTYQLGEDLAHSEDNKILESIHNKSSNITLISKEKIGQDVFPDKDMTAIVFWLSSFFSIETIFPDDFIPYWQEDASRKDKGSCYQGTIKGVPVFIIYKFHDQKSYSDSIFIFESSPFSIHECEVEQNGGLTGNNTRWENDREDCLILSVTNLSEQQDMRKKIADDLIKKGLNSGLDQNETMEKLKTEVVLQFYKGLLMESLKIDNSKIKIFDLK